MQFTLNCPLISSKEGLMGHDPFVSYRAKYILWEAIPE